MNTKQLRNRLKLSQEALARKLMVSVRTVSRWETGLSKPAKTARLKLEKLDDKTANVK